MHWCACPAAAAAAAGTSRSLPCLLGWLVSFRPLAAACRASTAAALPEPWLTLGSGCRWGVKPPRGLRVAAGRAVLQSTLLGLRVHGRRAFPPASEGLLGVVRGTPQPLALLLRTVPTRCACLPACRAAVPGPCSAAPTALLVPRLAAAWQQQRHRRQAWSNPAMQVPGAPWTGQQAAACGPTCACPQPYQRQRRRHHAGQQGRRALCRAADDARLPHRCARRQGAPGSTWAAAPCLHAPPAGLTGCARRRWSGWSACWTGWRRPRCTAGRTPWTPTCALRACTGAGPATCTASSSSRREQGSPGRALRWAAGELTVMTQTKEAGGSWHRARHLASSPASAGSRAGGCQLAADGTGPAAQRQACCQCQQKHAAAARPGPPWPGIGV